MKIAFFVENFPARSETAIFFQIAEAVKNGHEVTVFSITQGTFRERDPRNQAVSHQLRHIVVPTPKSRVHAFAILINAFISHPACFLTSLIDTKGFTAPASVQVLAHLSMLPKNLQFDVIHGQFGTSARRAAMLLECRAITGSLIATFRGFDANVVPRKVSKSYYTQLFSRAQFITVSSLFMRDRLIELGAPVEKIEIVYNGINVERFLSAPSAPSRDLPFRTVMVARLIDCKGTHVAIQAIARARSEGHDVVLDVVGDGPEKNSLQSLATAQGVSDSIKFHGSLSHDEIVGVFESSHVFLMPGVQGRDGSVEAFGNAVLEAQAAGLPVIGANIGGIPETFVDRFSGLLIPTNNVEALSDAITLLLTNKTLWALLKGNSRSNVDSYMKKVALHNKKTAIYERAIVMPATHYTEKY